MLTTAARATDTANSAMIAGTNFRKYGATFTFDPAVEWRLSNTLTFEGSAAYSRSYQWYDSDAEGFFNVVSARMNGLSWGFTAAPSVRFAVNKNILIRHGAFGAKYTLGVKGTF